MTDPELVKALHAAVQKKYGMIDVGYLENILDAYHAELRSRQMKIAGREPTSDQRAIMEYFADRNNIAAGLCAAWDAIPYPDETGETK